MKKLSLTLAFIGVILTSATAQSDYDEQKFHFGLKASPVISWGRIDAPVVKNDAIRIGFTYGLITEFAFTKNYAFATGLEISYKGVVYSDTAQGRDDFGNVIKVTNLKRTQKFQIIELPIALKLKTNEIGYMKYYGQFGILPGFIVKSTENIDSEDQIIQPDRSKRGNQSDFSFFNISLIVGLGIEYNLGGGTAFTSGLHYTNGLIDVWKEKNAQMKLDAITLNIGVLF